jgi:hypothetical protein
MRLVLTILIFIGLCSIQAVGSPIQDLLEAAKTGSAENVKDLLKAGANVDIRDEEHGLTALMWAAVRGHRRVVQILLEAGADVHATDSNFALTALMWAVASNKVEVAKALLNAGARVNARSMDSTTALIIATCEGHIDTIRFLLDAGADVHAQTDSGWTAQLYAQNMGRVDISYLLENAAIMLPEPLLFGGNVVIKESKWREGAESILARAVRIDFSQIEVDYTVTDREKNYFKENNYSEDQIRSLKEYQAYQNVLWYSFANKPEESLFDPITTENWYEKWCYYRDKLINKAGQAGFSKETLKKCIEVIEPDPNGKTALLPVGAYYAKHGEDNVWIIICKWEYAQLDESDEGTPWFSLLMHVRGWAISEKDCTVLTYVTCGNYPFFCQ